MFSTAAPAAHAALGQASRGFLSPSAAAAHPQTLEMLLSSPPWSWVGERSSASETPTLDRPQSLCASGCFHPLADEPGLELASLPDRRRVFGARRSKEQAWGPQLGSRPSRAPPRPSTCPAAGPGPMRHPSRAAPHLRSR